MSWGNGGRLSSRAPGAGQRLRLWALRRLACSISWRGARNSFLIRIGTSGWVYDDWRKRFYPAGLAQRNWLAYYTQHFDTVELNATTYRLP
ncbi:MAG: DUF72 domain-containing protein, partial [Candidatus Eremiobacteraeota bacterium]|nr:DUF72 domain-containing protein [Candidatus Eremiobacteraeota bacterium]